MNTSEPPPSKPHKGSYDDTTGTGAKAPDSQGKVLNDMPGPTKSKCVVVGDRSDVRSGSLAMGNFANARKAFRAAKNVYEAPPSSFYVIPKSVNGTRVVVTAKNVSGKVDPVTVKSTQVEEAAQWKYFPVELQLTASGTWQFEVEVNKTHGCFVAKF